MRELHVVAVSEDGRHVVLASRKGAAARGEFKVVMDDKLKAAIRGDLPRPGELRAPDSAVTPKEIQARLRAGETVEQIAASAGVPAARVERFAGPVLSERERMISGARAAVLERSRRGPSGLSLGDAVGEHLQEMAGYKPDHTQWTAKREESGRWLVQISYLARARTRSAGWRYDPATREVTAIDAASAALAHVDQPAARRGATTVVAAAPEALRQVSARAAARPAAGKAPSGKAAAAPARKAVAAPAGKAAAGPARQAAAAPVRKAVAAPARKAAPSVAAGKGSAAKGSAAKAPARLSPAHRGASQAGTALTGAPQPAARPVAAGTSARSAAAGRRVGVRPAAADVVDAQATTTVTARGLGKAARAGKAATAAPTPVPRAARKPGAPAQAKAATARAAAAAIAAEVAAEQVAAAEAAAQEAARAANEAAAAAQAEASAQAAREQVLQEQLAQEQVETVRAPMLRVVPSPAPEQAAEAADGDDDEGAPDRKQAAPPASTRDTPTRDTPTRDTPTRDTPTRDTPTRDTPTRDTSPQDLPAHARRQLPARRAAGGRASVPSWSDVLLGTAPPPPSSEPASPRD